MIRGLAESTVLDADQRKARGLWGRDRVNSNMKPYIVHKRNMEQSGIQCHPIAIMHDNRIIQLPKGDKSGCLVIQILPP